MYTKVKTSTEINNIRKAGKICSEVLSMLKSEAKAGLTTKQLADMAAKEITKQGGKASFMGYKGFPDVICISLNNEVVHGIPGDSMIKDGDLVSFDLGVTYNGMIVDSAISVIIGVKDKEKSRLLDATRASLSAGIKQLKDGCRVGDIGSAVERVLAKEKLGIVRDLVGHGVGHHVHEDPNIPNYGEAGTGPKLRSGMTIAIEPMATLGREEVYVDSDGWTIKTLDGSLSAHFEQTVLITPKGYEILTPFI